MDSIIIPVLKDYRKTVVDYARENGLWYLSKEKKRVYWSNESKWDDWGNWNVLQQTLEFELSHARHVESRSYVQNDGLIMNDSYKEYVRNFSEYETADLMNGWWYCFKTLFDLTSRNGESPRRYEARLLKDIKDKNDEQALEVIINNGYACCEKEALRLLFRFLKVVYTMGNITPAAVNPRADAWDSWEYKLLKYKDRFHKDYIQKLHFEEYENNGAVFANVNEYMESRTDRIISRGLRILGCYNSDNKRKVLNEIEVSLTS